MISSPRYIFLTVHSIYNNEQYLTFLRIVTKSKNWSHHTLFIVTCSLHFFTTNFNCRILFRFANWLYHYLILSSDHFMKVEFNLTNQIMFIPLFQIVKIVNIIHHCFEQLLFFEFVRHIKTLDPLWIKAIHDNFSHTKHLPHVTSLFKKNNHAISSCKSIQVG